MNLTDEALVEQIDIDAAALNWVGEKDRETFLSDIHYFKENWKALAGMRQRVEAFARHRIAALAIARPIIAREALDRAAETASDLFAFAVQSDTENGVRWLNERAAAAYLKDAPATLATIKALSDAILALREQYR